MQSVCVSINCKILQWNMDETRSVILPSDTLYMSTPEKQTWKRTNKGINLFHGGFSSIYFMEVLAEVRYKA